MREPDTMTPSLVDDQPRSSVYCAVTPRWHGAALAGVLILAAVLRFGGITSVGIRFDDESWYVSDARLWHRCARTLIDGAAIEAAVQGDKQVFQQRMNAIGVDFAARYDKPSQGYTFLGALMMFVVGDRPAALLVTNALLGTLSVAVLYALGSVLFNRSIALCAALVMAVSPYHLVYCRSAMAETSAGLFILLGILAWALGHHGRWPWRRAYLCAGLALGYAITCHYRSAYVPIVLLIFDLFVARHARLIDLKTPVCRPTALRRWAWLALGAAAPILAIDAVFRTAYLAAAITDSYLPGTAYLETCWRYLKFLRHVSPRGAGGLWNPQVLSAYVAYFVHWHGVLAALVTAFGLFSIMRWRGKAKWVSVFVLVTVGILLFQRYVVARAISPVVPFLCLCLAVGVHELAGLWKPMAWRSPATALLLCLLLCAPALARSWSLSEKRSHLVDACDFVVDQGGAVALPMDPRKYTLYFEDHGTAVVRAEPETWSSPVEATVADLRRQGIRWMITDPQRWHYRSPGDPWDVMFHWWHAMEDHLRHNAALAAEFPHLADYRWEFMVEAPGLTALREMIESGGGPIRIYDLQGTKPGRVEVEDAETIEVTAHGKHG